MFYGNFKTLKCSTTFKSPLITLGQSPLLNSSNSSSCIYRCTWIQCSAVQIKGKVRWLKNSGYWAKSCSEYMGYYRFKKWVIEMLGWGMLTMLMFLCNKSTFQNYRKQEMMEGQEVRARGTREEKDEKGEQLEDG